ncbi:MAG TPA: tetratricopeptide repeat protein [Longimicrobiaceae bacterium]|nr:tetratricopeptide repeat protein [Longimicrobiaceae bacterium]
MPHTESKSKRPRLKPRHVPPPLTHGGEIFDGEDILLEFKADLAVILWKSYENVTLWAASAPEERADLFTMGAARRRRADLRELDLDPILAEQLAKIAAMLSETDEASAAEIFGACRWISNWAVGKGATGTALLFMQAAAFATPQDSAAACAVGRLARLRADYGRAETWYRHAGHSARASGNRESYVLATIGLGKVYWKRGALPSARRCFMRAYRAARRYSLHELQGWALQDLAGVAIHAGRWRESAGYIRSALDVYGAGHRSVPRLINDVANSWMGSGWFVPALQVLEPLNSFPYSTPDQLCYLGSIARASGGAGEVESFRNAAAEIDRLLNVRLVPEVATPVLLDVARGAASLGDWDRAQVSASRALSLAHERGEGETRMVAEGVLESIKSDRLAERHGRTVRPATAPGENLDDIIQALITSANESTAAATSGSAAL